MKSEPQRLSTNFAREMIDMMPVIIRDKMAGEIKGHLQVEEDDGKGQWVVSANYNSSPFQGTHIAAKFYLTQEQLEDYQNKGAMCVLNAPPKN